MPVYTQNEAVKSSGFALPRDRYQVRVLAATFGLSKAKEQPMVTLKCEVVGKDGETSIVDPTGAKCEIAGMEFTYYISFAPRALANAFNIFSALGNPHESIDTDNYDPSWMIGKVFDAILSSKQRIAQDERRQPILDANGQQIVQGYDVQISTVVGLSSGVGPNAF